MCIKRQGKAVYFCSRGSHTTCIFLKGLKTPTANHIFAIMLEVQPPVQTPPQGAYYDFGVMRWVYSGAQPEEPLKDPSPEAKPADTIKQPVAAKVAFRPSYRAAEFVPMSPQSIVFGPLFSFFLGPQPQPELAASSCCQLGAFRSALFCLQLTVAAMLPQVLPGVQPPKREKHALPIVNPDTGEELAVEKRPEVCALFGLGKEVIGTNLRPPCPPPLGPAPVRSPSLPYCHFIPAASEWNSLTSRPCGFLSEQCCRMQCTLLSVHF